MRCFLARMQLVMVGIMLVGLLANTAVAGLAYDDPTGGWTYIYDGEEADEASNDEPYRSHALIAWTREQMGEANTDWMRGLPFDHRIRPPGQGNSAELLIVHATPTDVEAILITQPNEISGHTVTPEDEARGMLGEARASLIVYGHIHYFSEGVIGTQRVASIGAIGFPFDGDPTAAYAILEWDGASWNIEPHRVPYDHKAVAAEIVAQDTFLAAPRAERILLSRPVPFE